MQLRQLPIRKPVSSAALERLRHHVTGAIERKEASPITEQPAAHVTIIMPEDKPAQPPIKDFKDGLTPYNSVTISHSGIPDLLPPGRYHYSTFDAIDVFNLGEKKSRKDFQDRIEELENQIQQDKRENEVISEQRFFAQELVEQWDAELESIDLKKTTKAELIETIKQLKSLRENSMFET